MSADHVVKVDTDQVQRTSDTDTLTHDLTVTGIVTEKDNKSMLDVDIEEAVPLLTPSFSVGGVLADKETKAKTTLVKPKEPSNKPGTGGSYYIGKYNEEYKKLSIIAEEEKRKSSRLSSSSSSGSNQSVKKTGGKDEGPWSTTSTSSTSSYDAFYEPPRPQESSKTEEKTRPENDQPDSPNSKTTYTMNQYRLHDGTLVSTGNGHSVLVCLLILLL